MTQRIPNTWILTGWGWPDYAAAAARVLLRFPGAAIRGVSTRRLPELVESFAADPPPPGSRILILGVGLSAAPSALVTALKALKAARVTVEWCSALPLPDGIADEVSRLMAIRVDPDADGIADAAATAYGTFPESGFEDRIRDLLKPSQRGGEPWRTLLEAAMFAYRNYQDEAAYPNAIRRLAAGDAEERWTAAENRLVAHYRRYGHREIVGRSPAMRALQEQVNTVAQHDRARVLILGESGTGKETVAVQIHNKSRRRDEAFVSFNCASVTPDLLESRFLGYEKGAFTGANERRPGLFELADGGTLFLDEIGELPAAAQGVLLRVLEGGRFTRIGDREEVEVDVRVIAATHRDIPSLVRDGAFREDLFYRLCVIPIRVPPLREHPEDIADIANGYWLRLHRRRLDAAQLAALCGYSWPGNVREFYNVLERASVTGQSDFAQLMAEHLTLVIPPAGDRPAALPDNMEAATRLHARSVFEKYGGNLSKAAAALGISRNTARKHLG